MTAPRDRRAPRIPRALGVVIVAVLAAALLAVAAPPAATAADAPSPAPLLQRTGDVVTADPLPTVQLDDGYVWAQTTIGTTVYAAGSFVNARAAGAEPGMALTPRSNILAYDITTGDLLPFAPQVNGVIKAVAASPDGTRVYIGGSFNRVNGVARYNIAALDAVTGQLVPGFGASAGGVGVYGIAVTAGAVYAAGRFTQANGVARQNLAAFAASGGALLNWAPTTDLQVDALVVEPGNQKIIAGGRFYTVNGVAGQQRGIAALDAGTGATVPWAVTSIIKNGWASGDSAGKAGIFALSTDAGGVYGTGWVFASVNEGNVEGAFAVDAGAGDLRWLADCHGDHYGVWSTGTVVYTTAHTHQCDTVGLWPEQSPRAYRYVEAYTTDARGTLTRTPSEGSIYKNWAGTPAPSAFAWYPDFLTGKASGLGQAGLSITGAGGFISIAGEFPGVNNQRFQGIVRFSTQPATGAKQGPRVATTAWTPSARSVAAGEVRVQIPANWDRDDLTLTYELRRDGASAPVATTTAPSTWWQRPGVTLKDASVVAGQTYTYRVLARDGDGNTMTSAPVTVTAATQTASGYRAAVLDDGAAHFWPLDENDGAVGSDWAGSADLAVRGATRGVTGPELAAPSTATSFAGDSGSFAATATPEPGANTFSLEAWFQTTSTAGGKIVGFGNSPNAGSGSYDRHVYLGGDGRLVFGVYPGGVRTLESDSGYNDGRWHHVVGTLSDAGMALHVDGELVAVRSDTTSAEGYSGYWKVGGDTIGGWPGAGDSAYLKGAIGDVAVYPTALSASAVAAHYLASGRGDAAPAAPGDAYGAAVYGLGPALYWRLDETAGTTAVDSSIWPLRRTGTYHGAVTKGEPAGIAGGIGHAITLAPDGASGVSTNTPVAGPQIFTLETWFATTSTTAGTILGFGDRAVGSSTTRDRRIAMTDDGAVTFRVGTGDTGILRSAPGLDDGAWHHVVASLSPEGMRLYLDGALVDSNGVTSAPETTGYWRLGGDGGSWTGSLDETALYPVALTAADVAAHAAIGAGRQPVNHPPRDVAFTHSVTGLTAAFAATAADADGDELAYAWDFGDGTTATGAQQTHLFPHAGNFDVTLTVTDEHGASTAVTESVQPEHADPVAAFTIAPSGLSIAVDASGSAAADGASLAYAWDWGDATAADVGVTASHTYAAAGDYDITLTVTDSTGAANVTVTTVTVTAPPAADLLAADAFGRDVTGGWGQADRGGAWTVASGAASAASVHGGKGVLTVAPGQTRNLILGGTTVRDSATTVTYTMDATPANGAGYVAVGARRIGSANYFTRVWHRETGAVWLVTQNGGTVLASRAINGLTWTQGATFVLKAQVTGTNPTTIRAKVWREGTAEPAAWQIESTDGAAALQAPGAPVLHYALGGAAAAPGTVRFDDVAVRDLGAPTANLAPTAAFTGATAGLTASVDGSTSTDADGSIAGYDWNWGDGSAAGSGPAAAHTYAAAGDYDVTLTVTDDRGERATVTRRITVAAPPAAAALHDEFDRTAAAGWGTADVGGAWTISGGAVSAAAADGGAARLTLAPGSTRTAVLAQTPLREVAATVDFSIDAGPASGASYVGVVPRHTGAAYYVVNAWLRADGTVWLVAQKGSAVLQSTSATGLTYAAGDRFTLDVEATGTTSTVLRAKIWKLGTTAPAAWQLTATDASGDLQNAGSVGLRANRTSTSTAPAVVSFERFDARPAS